jgi:predicted nucleic acid-binding protein
LAQFRIRTDREPEQADVLRMARAQGLSVYDAAYLELAYREKLPLATLDRRLGEAARLMGVQLFEKDGK